jgi:protein-S-isoprenylcysteine O-methyltransferase Ste14
MNPSYNRRISIAAILAWLIPAFAILEPVWMLTPFVGFLYGSVLNLSFLETHCWLAWLLLFVLPARGIGMPGLILTAAGLALFAVGAWQVYGAKLFKKGVVSGGVYRRLRHPQYTGLMLAAMGLVLLWSRFIAYLSLFIMVFLYFLLARREEALCQERFGYAYEAYRQRTLGLFPGFDALVGLANRSSGMSLAIGFFLTLALALGSGWGVMQARQAFSAGTPLFHRTVAWPELELPAVSPRIPYLDPSGKQRHFMFLMKPAEPQAFFQALQASRRIRAQLAPFRQAGMNTALLLFQPRLGARERNGQLFFTFYLAPLQADLDLIDAGVHRFMANARLLGLLCIEAMQAGISPEPVHGEIHTVTAVEMERVPAVRARVENKVNILLSRF